MNKRNEYRVRLEWIDVRVSHTFTTGRKREGERMLRAFSEVALMRRTALEFRPHGEDWRDF